MNAVPYIVGVLLGVLGWQISALTEDVRSTRAVAYEVERASSTNRITASVHNVSKINALAGATFALACTPGDRCLLPNTEDILIHPPNAISAVVIQANDSVVIIKTTLAAGGRMEFGAALSGSGNEPKFLFIPEDADPLDIYVHRSDSIRGYLVENYFELVFASFAFLAVAFMVDVFSSNPTAPTKRVNRKRKRLWSLPKRIRKEG